MLQALFKQKLGRAIQHGTFHGIEDTLTSSVVGLLQYLPDELFWRILKGSCGASWDSLPETVGVISSVHFWERMDAKGTYNTLSVEPDVWIETDSFDIIIEAKRNDSFSDNSQSTHQWFNEIVAMGNYNGEHTDKELLFIAIGGNNSLRNQLFDVNGVTHVIHTASWYDLLRVVMNTRETLSESKSGANHIRILDDIITAMQFHGVVHTIWLDSLQVGPINTDAQTFLRDSWVFNNKKFLSDIQQQSIKLESLSGIWTIR